MYLINRTPSKTLNNKSPYELLFKSSSYSHFRCFGCLCFISTLSHNRHKFAHRARKCVFLSYPHGIKGYKVLHLDSKSVYISRDNVFYEHIFPLASIPSPTLSLSSYLDNFVFPHVIPEILLKTSFPSDIPLVPKFSPSTSIEPLSTESLYADSIFANSHNSLISSSLTPNIVPPVPLRKSTRVHKPPSYLTDYSCKLVVTKPELGLPYDISDGLSYCHLGPTFHSFVMAVTTTPSEPTFFHHAVKFPKWRAIMDKEITALE